MDSKPEWLTVTEVAAELRVPKRTVLGWITDRRLPAIKPGKAYRVRRSDLDQLIDASSTTAP